MSSTPKHLALYQAFDWKPPQFAHVGLLLDKDRQKLSKRNNSIDIRSFRNMGIFPETLTNFLSLLGWSHNTGQDVMSMKDLITNASMKYTRGDSVVGFEKLYFLQKRHAVRYASSPPEDNPTHDLRMLASKLITTLLEEKMLKEDLPIYASLAADQREDIVHEILLADAQNYRLPSDFISRNIYFFKSPSTSSLRNTVPNLRLHQIPSFIPLTPPIPPFLELISGLSSIDFAEWNSPPSTQLRQKVAWIVEQGALRSLKHTDGDMEAEDDAVEKRVKGAWSKLVHGYLRWALMAGMPGPDAVNVMRILGKDECLRRFARAEEVINGNGEDSEEKSELD